jgi:hypothetical protein
VKQFTSPVWHFQDDAVTGGITVFPTAASNMPSIEQFGYSPERYLFPWDGPDAISQFSKDLAFELYTQIPEPSAVLLACVGFAAACLRRAGRKE